MPQADVLIVTVTDVESRAVMEVFHEATGMDAKPELIDQRIYLDLGTLKESRVFMVLCGMGAGGVAGSQETVRRGIEALSPAAVVMVGIAFGIDETKQAIGDVLVSERLSLYNLQRRGTREGKLDVTPRGDRPSASASLLSRFRVADLSWSKAKVRFGLVLSGDHLTDNIDYRAELLALEPEALGGEMEGAGLYVACQNEKVDWILVKAICDWADGNKGEKKDVRQKTAAHNAAAFVLHALQQAPLKSVPLAPAASQPQKVMHSSLPPQPYFFGREKELASIAQAISPDARTWGALIDGPGGIGKTALAVRAGHIAPDAHFDRRIFLSAKVRELTPAGEQKLEDSMLPNFTALLTELARELGEENIEKLDPNERANAVRRALADERALIIIDNVETFEEPERARLYQFLSRLPPACKAIVTSRRRADIDARVVRLDRLERKDALDLIAELAKNKPHLQKATEQERGDLYEITQGNPLLIRWTAGQLGRQGSHCRTIAEAYAFLQSAPKDNDPLEYIFGDLLETFTEHETAVLAALVHFTQPAPVKWIADVAGIAEPAAITALEDLTDRALLVLDEATQAYLLPPLAATFLRRRCPEVISETGDRLADRAYVLALENGGENYKRFPKLEAEWPAIAAALPLLLQGENDRLQRMRQAIGIFLEYSGRWDELLSVSLRMEERAVAAVDFHNAGWAAYDAGWTYQLRGQGQETLDCAIRSAAHWNYSPRAGAMEKAYAIRLRGLGLDAARDFPAAIEAFQEALLLYRAIEPESNDVALVLNDLGEAERQQSDDAAAERDYREALRIAKIINNREGIAIYTGNLALLALNREEWPTAETVSREALQLAEEVGRQELIGWSSSLLARALARQGKAEEGLPHAQRAVEIFTRLRIPDDLKAAEAALTACGG